MASCECRHAIAFTLFNFTSHLIKFFQPHVNAAGFNSKICFNMIILPTRRKLERRRDALYERLTDVLSIHQTEDIMRRIHIINLKLRTYFKREHEPQELFED